MAKQGVHIDEFRSVDHPIASGVYPDMRDHGWEVDAWPELFPRVLAADILVIAGPIWLGDNSSETKKIIERLYAHSGELNDHDQSLYYGRVGGCLITGDEQDDGTRTGLNNDFTNRNTTFMTWNMIHLAHTLKSMGGFPTHGNQRREWDAGARFDFENPEYRA